MDTVPVTIQGIVYKKINYFSNKNYIYLSLLVLKFELNWVAKLLGHPARFPKNLFDWIC